MPTGSFGLGGGRLPGGAQRDDKRVASLGGGRANVPLGVVRPPRSASAGSGVPSTAGSPVSTPPPASPTLERGSAAMEASLSTQSLASSTTSSAVDRSLKADTESVSSLQAETGSINNPDPTSVSTPTATAESSPLSSPIIEAALIDEPVPAVPVLRGPLDALRAQESRPTRSGSQLSVSSMLVETGSTASTEDGSEAAPSTAGEMPTHVGDESDAAEPATPTELAPVDEDVERERQEETQRELERYEREETDVTAAGSSTPVVAPVVLPLAAVPLIEEPVPTPSPLESPELDAQAPVQDAPASPKEPASAEITPVPTTELPYLDKAFEPEPASPMGPSGMPQVKCSDCGHLIDLMELADHACAPSNSPPALSSPVMHSPASPVISLHRSRTPPPASPPPAAYQPVPFRTSPSSSFSRPSPSTSRPSSAHSITIPTSTPLARSGSSSSNNSRFASKLDSFVQHPTTLIPDDVYSSDEDGGVGYDLDDYMPDSPTVPVPISPNMPGVGRVSPRSSFDLPEGIEEGAFDEPGFAPARGEEGRRRGKYAITDEDDEEGYEGGVATIVRTTASHRTS